RFTPYRRSRAPPSTMFFLYSRPSTSHIHTLSLHDALPIYYFKRFPITVRNKVKTVTMDLNYYYDIMAKELFPNAQVILDRFHIVQMLNRSFNSCRIQEMKKHKKGSWEYNLLKYYWKL